MAYQRQFINQRRRLARNLCCMMLSLWSWVSFSINYALATPVSTADNEGQNLRSRQEAADRQQRKQQAVVFLQPEKNSGKELSLPAESPSFVIHNLQIEGDCVQEFSWLQTQLNQYTGCKIGVQGIKHIAKVLNNALIEHGYVTTRIVIPEQDISTGALRLVLIRGRIGEIRLNENSVQLNWRNAFPVKQGDILNLRHLEQGLEQMKRVPSQDINMELVPGKNQGESDIVLTVKKTAPYKLVFSVDDSGMEETGKIQMAETFFVDNLFGLNDLFNITQNGDGDRAGSIHGTRGDSIYYSIPYKDSTFSFTSNHYNYHQTVAIDTQPIYSGENDSMEFHLTQLLDRDQTSKTNLECAIIKGHIRSYIEDTEIEVQRKDTTALEIGISHKHYFGPTTLDIEIDNKRGVSWFGAQVDSTTPDLGTTRYNMWLIDTSLTTPVTFGEVRGSYSFTFHGQYTNNVLYQTDMISIGNRYTVRGFDGRQTLSSENGWYIRNEVAVPIGSSGLQVYTGLDYGIVYGPYTQSLLGRILVGSVVGLRGGTKNVNYELFVGRPIRKPDGFATESQTYGFQYIYQI